MIKINNYDFITKLFRVSKTAVKPVISYSGVTSPILTRPLVDSFEHTSPRVTLEQVKVLFPKGKIEGGFIRKEMLKIKTELLLSSLTSIKSFKTWLHSVDLSKKMKEADYKEVMEFMNLHNGEFIPIWQETKNGIGNIQKLALFVRSLKRIDMMEFYKNLDKESWKTCMDGIINRPKEVVSPLMWYKYDSRPINNAITFKNGSLEINAQIDIIRRFIDTQRLHSDMILHRGEGSFLLFDKIVTDEKGTTLKQLLEEFTQGIKENKYTENDINLFVAKYLQKKQVIQERFISTALEQKAGKQYAQNILWHLKVPKGTKGSMIESYNVERASEAEVLLQRNSKITINDAKFDIQNNRWEMWGEISQ